MPNELTPRELDALDAECNSITQFESNFRNRIDVYPRMAESLRTAWQRIAELEAENRKLTAANDNQSATIKTCWSYNADLEATVARLTAHLEAIRAARKRGGSIYHQLGWIYAAIDAAQESKP